VRISAKADYAVRAAVELAAAPPGKPVKAEIVATNQEIPRDFLENILRDLRRAGLVRSVRGAEGGSMLARPAADIHLADVLRAVEGPLAAVRGVRPEALDYQGASASLVDVWIALRANLGPCSTRSRWPTSRRGGCPRPCGRQPPSRRTGNPADHVGRGLSGRDQYK